MDLASVSSGLAWLPKLAPDRTPQSHTQFEHTCAPARPTPVLGAPNERAASAPEPDAVEFCACPGKPTPLAAPAFSCAAGSEPKNLAAPIPPAVPLEGTLPWV